MTFATYAIVIISCTLLGYMIGVSDGKVEGRIESNQKYGGYPSAAKPSEPR